MSSKARAWSFVDPRPRAGEASTYVFPTNPNAMTSPFPERNITARSSTAIDGQVLLFEGPAGAASWQFSGNCLSAQHYEELRSWVYDRLGRRIYVYDHFGRRIVCVLRSFNPEPRRDIHRYWHHTYSISALVISVGEPTMGEVWK